jgi:hypothetical protein
MTTPNIDFDAIANAAAESEDQTKMKEGGGGFDRPVPPAGRCTVRLQQYIELGKQPSNNPKYKPAEQVMLRFEVNSPKHLIELDDGTKIPNQITMRLPKGGKTSKYGRLFTALNYSGKFRHFAQMVGKGAWLAEITHNVVNEGKDNEKTYANLDKNKAWTFTAPAFENPATGEVSTVPVPELDGDPQVFMFENAGIGDADYKALWDALYIEGEHESGDKKGQSKNWIQELIQDSLTYDTSRLKQIVEGNSAAELEDLPIDGDEELDDEPANEEKKPAKKKAEKKKEPEPEPKEEPEEEEQEDDEDPLVAAGLA